MGPIFLALMLVSIFVWKNPCLGVLFLFLFLSSGSTRRRGSD